MRLVAIETATPDTGVSRVKSANVSAQIRTVVTKFRAENGRDPSNAEICKELRRIARNAEPIVKKRVKEAIDWIGKNTDPETNEFRKIAERIGSNVATVKRWYKTLGLYGMTPSAAAKEIERAKRDGIRPNK